PGLPAQHECPALSTADGSDQVVKESALPATPPHTRRVPGDRRTNSHDQQAILRAWAFCPGQCNDFADQGKDQGSYGRNAERSRSGSRHVHRRTCTWEKTSMSQTDEDAQQPGRRWFHFRPEPRRRSDLMGFNSTWWMVLIWIIVIVLVIYPGPYW